MKIAFYAPMKPIDHPTPSGDRQVGRMLIRACTELGHETIVASGLRTWIRDGSPAAQSELARRAHAEADGILANWAQTGYRPDLWITYHLYHQAPDWIGPRICEALSLPYVVIEASRAPRREHDEWSVGFDACEAALARATTVIAMHEKDKHGLAPVIGADRLRKLAPFIDTAPFRPIAGQRAYPASGTARLLTVAMMRQGQKDWSYAALAQALPKLRQPDWHLTIAGDGPRRAAVLERFAADRITYLGLCPTDQMARVYLAGDLFGWTAVKEAYGLVFLEAQSAGLAVVGSDAGGVPEIVYDGVTGLLTRERDVEAFAQAVDGLMSDRQKLAQMGRQAAWHAKTYHDIEVAKKTLAQHLEDTLGRHHAVSK
jgi:glycosyltransferase involved in cell wall biosynthesis